MQPIPTTNFLPLPSTDGWTKPSLAEDRQRLEQKVEEFASVLYAQMFGEMRRAAASGKEDEEEGVMGQSGGFGGGDSEYFMHLFDEQVGKQFAARGGDSLVEALKRQMLGRYDAQAQRPQP